MAETMEIREVSAAEYSEATGVAGHVFNSVAFTELNRVKADDVHYLVFEDSKLRFGIILGEREDGFYSPFSAPFGGFTACGVQRIRYMDEAVCLLRDYWRSGLMNTLKPVYITLPPLFYDCSQLSKWANTLMRNGRLQHIDLNYHFDLSRMSGYKDLIERNARKNLQRTLYEDFVFLKLDSTSSADIERAYSVIKANRNEHGYPLRMTLQAVKDTVEIIPADFFILSHSGRDVAAAQVFHVSPGTAQVVYWGDLHAYSHLRTMNRLAYEMFTYYHGQGLRVLDIGPSTENGVPNHGLCEFKEGIGCAVSPKYSFEL